MKNLTEFNEIVVVPLRRPPPPRRAPLWGGVQFPDEAPDWCFHIRGGKTRVRRPPRDELSVEPERLPGTYLYAGEVISHFGHMVSEFMHRLSPLGRPEYDGIRPLFVAPAGRRKEKVILDVLAAMRLPEPVFVDSPVRVDRLIIGEPAKMLHSPPMPGYADFLEERVGYLRGNGPRHPKRLAVLRGHLWAGRCIGEAWLERQLAEAGYFPFHPEQYPMQIQMEHYFDAEKIILTEGSAIHVLDLMPPLHAEIAVLNRRSPRLAESSLRTKCAALHMFDGFLIGHPTFSPNKRPQALSGVNMPEFLEFLKEKQFIDTIPTADFFADKTAIRQDLLHYLRSPAAGEFEHERSDEEVLTEAVAFLVRGIAQLPTTTLRANQEPRPESIRRKPGRYRSPPSATIKGS
jgi:hypothetical protein